MLFFKLTVAALALLGLWLYARTYVSFAAAKPAPPAPETVTATGVVVSYLDTPYLVYHDARGSVAAKQLVGAPVAAFIGAEATVTGVVRDSALLVDRIEAPSAPDPAIAFVSAGFSERAAALGVSIRPDSIEGGAVTAGVSSADASSTIAFVPGALQDLGARVVTLTDATACATAGCRFAVLADR